MIAWSPLDANLAMNQRFFSKVNFKENSRNKKDPGNSGSCVWLVKKQKKYANLNSAIKKDHIAKSTQKKKRRLMSRRVTKQFYVKY